MDGFEAWTRAEITRLRSEADALDCILKRFLAEKLPSQSYAERRFKPADDVHSTAMGAARKRRSKNDALLDAIDQSGPHGLTLDEIMDAANRSGINSHRSSIRSFCWTEKQRGRLIQPEVGRFASALAAKDEAAGTHSTSDPAASQTPDDADRRGDVGYEKIAH